MVYWNLNPGSQDGRRRLCYGVFTFLGKSFKLFFQMPDCLARCSADKPLPPPEYNVVIDTSKTSLTDELWERQQIW